MTSTQVDVPRPLVPDGDDYGGDSLRSVAQRKNYRLPEYYRENVDDFAMLDMESTKTPANVSKGDEDIDYAAYGVFLVMKPSKRNTIAIATVYVGFTTINDFRAFCNTHAASILGPVWKYIKETREQESQKKNKVRKTAIKITSWELKTIYRHLNFLREPAHRETLAELTKPDAEVPYLKEDSGFLLTFLGGLLRLCKAFPHVFRERLEEGAHPIGSRFVAGVSLEDLARANMVWVHYIRMRKEKKYYLSASPLTNKRQTLKLDYSESTAAARTRRQAENYQDPLLWQVWHTPMTPAGLYIPEGAHVWARQYVHDWYFKQPSLPIIIPHGEGPPMGHILMVNNYNTLRGMLPVMKPGFDHSEPNRGPWVPLDAADKLRNSLLRRGMTNPPDNQAFRDLDNNELTASYLLSALDLLDGNKNANLKVFDHSLPWPQDMRQAYSHRLRTAHFAANNADEQTKATVLKSLLPAAAIWTRLPSLLTPAKDRAGLALLVEEIDYTRQGGLPLFGLKDGGASWLYNMTTLDNTVIPQTRSAWVQYLIGKSPCLSYATAVTISVLGEDEENHLLIITENETIFHVMSLLLGVLGVPFVMHRHGMDRKDLEAIQTAWNQSETARICLALRNAPPKVVIYPRKINWGIYIGGPLTLHQMAEVISSIYDHATARDITWHFFKTRGSHADVKLKSQLKLMLDETGLNHHMGILERLDHLRLGLRQSFSMLPFLYMPIPPGQGGEDDVAYVGCSASHLLHLVGKGLSTEQVDAASHISVCSACYLLGRLGVGKAVEKVAGNYDKLLDPTTVKQLPEEERPSPWMFFWMTGVPPEEEDDGRTGTLLYPGHTADQVSDMKLLAGLGGDDPTANIAGMIGPGASYPTYTTPQFLRVWRDHPTPPTARDEVNWETIEEVLAAVQAAEQREMPPPPLPLAPAPPVQQQQVAQPTPPPAPAQPVGQENTAAPPAKRKEVQRDTDAEPPALKRARKAASKPAPKAAPNATSNPAGKEAPNPAAQEAPNPAPQVAPTPAPQAAPTPAPIEARPLRRSGRNRNSPRLST